MASHIPEKYTKIQFINTALHTQDRGGTYAKRIRRHVMSRSWQVGKDQARSLTFPGDRLLRPSELPLVCEYHHLGSPENTTANVTCLLCQRSVLERRNEGCNLSSQDTRSTIEPEGKVTLTSGYNATDQSSLVELGDIHDIVGPGDRDPFSSFPIPIGPDDRRVEMLLRHWIMELSPVLCTLEDASKITANPLADVLVPLALNNLAMLHGLLAFSSGLLDAHSGLKTGSITTLTHRLNAIRLINQSMNDIQLATSDAVLTSIMFVTGSDCMFKDYVGHRTHLDGIYRILELRGGIDNLRLTQPLVYWRIIWADQFRGLYASTPPRFQISPISSKIPVVDQDPFLPADESESWHTSFNLSDQFWDLVKSINDLVQVLESSRGTLVSPSIIEHYDHQRAWIASRLLSLIAEKANIPARAYEQCCYLATLVYHFVHFKPYTFMTGVEGMLLGRLKQALEETDLDSCWGVDIELLLWISFTAAGVEDATRDWFVELLKRVRKALIPKPGLKRLKFILSKFLWNERTSSLACDKLYKKLVRPTLEGEVYEMQISLRS